MLRRSRENALVLLYRESQLQTALSAPDVREFLAGFGYPSELPGTEACLLHLKERVVSCADGGFPHEIGIFLGYPLCDVRGFIEQRGKHCLVQGFWKVYGSQLPTT